MRRSNQSILKKIKLNLHWKDWCWNWNSNTFATWWEELTHLKRPWCWERLRAGGEGGDRGWDDWMASPTQWTWVWANPGSGEEQGSLACSSPWGCKELDTLSNWATTTTQKPATRLPKDTDRSWTSVCGASSGYAGELPFISWILPGPPSSNCRQTQQPSITRLK